MKNKILFLMIGAIIGGTVGCAKVKADTKIKVQNDYEKAIEEIQKSKDTEWINLGIRRSNNAIFYLNKAMYEEQLKQTKILEEIKNKLGGK